MNKRWRKSGEARLLKKSVPHIAQADSTSTPSALPATNGTDHKLLNGSLGLAEGCRTKLSVGESCTVSTVIMKTLRGLFEFVDDWPGVSPIDLFDVNQIIAWLLGFEGDG